MWFDKALLPKAGLVLTDFHSRFDYDGGSLDLPDGNGQLAGGTIQLKYHVETEEPGSPFKAAFHVEDVSLDELITQAGGRPKFAEGRLRGDIKVWKLTGEDQQATGQIELVNGRFSNLPLLQTIGDALQIDDIRHLAFKKAQLDCALEGTVLHIQPLVLVSNNLQISARGDYRLDEDRLALHARLTIDRPISVRFLEYMPIGMVSPPEWRARYISNEEALSRLTDAFPNLIPEDDDIASTSRNFRIPGASGTVGLINPISHRFCEGCNRLRLTANGRLVPCLADNYEYDLMTPLRAGCTDADIIEHTRAALTHKPIQSDFEGRLGRGGSLRIMAQIGG